MDMSLRSMGDKHDLQKELGMQNMQIEELQKQIEEIEAMNEMLKSNRPRVGKLPPLEGQQRQ
jgi:predicted RNase H-like nuclease (RuvC/YqgF family)